MSAEGEASILIQLQQQGHAVEHVRLRAVDDAPEAPAKRRGRYDIVGPIAEGAIGTVWKARDIDLGRDVAIKALRDDNLDDPEAVRRIIEEAQIGGQLQHPGIVDVYEIGLQDDERPFFAMRLVKGSTLSERLDEQDGTANERLIRIFARVCRAMAYAHARGVVHRDLKPSNVMVGAFGEVQILDWGMARILPRGGVADERRSLQPELTLIATARSESEDKGSADGGAADAHAYMAPEQALGHDPQLDARCDVFALGAMLCEILTGAPPYVGAPEEVRAAARAARLDDALARIEGCAADAALRDLAKRCLAPMRRDRPRHAGAVAEALDAHLASLAERATRSRVRAAEDRAAREQSEEEAREARRARRQGIAVGLSILAALVVGGVSVLWMQRTEAERAQRADGAVSRALDDAVRLVQLETWVEARTAAEQAVELAKAEGVSIERRRRAQDLLESAAKGHERAQAVAAQNKADATLLTTLTEARFRWGDELDPRETDAFFADAFRTWGVDAEKEQPAQVAERLRAHGGPFAVQVASALADWSWLRREKLDGEDAAWRSLLDLADDVDADAERRRLRRADVDVDLDGLTALGKEAEPAADSIPDLSRVGGALREQGATDEAEALLRRLWLAKPDDVWVCYRLGNVLSQRRPHEAVAFYEAALALRPESLEVRHRLGLALLYGGQRDEAIETWRDCMKRHPGHGHMLAHIAQAMIWRGRVDEALELSTEAVRLDPDDYFGRYIHGAGLWAAGRYEETLVTARASAAAKPSWVGGPWMVAVSLGRTGRVIEGIDTLVKWSEDTGRGDPAWAANQVGTELFRDGQYAGAEEALTEGVRLDPHSVLANANLARTRFRRGDLDGALQAYGRAATSQAADPHEQRTRANAWLAALERAAPLAARLEELVIAPPPEDVRTRVDVALLCYGRGRFLDAARLFRGAIRSADADPEAPKIPLRLIAAHCAARAGCGHGPGTDGLTHEERAALRTQARHWLEEELHAQRVLSTSEPDGVAQRLRQWEGAFDLRCVHWDRELRKLPEAEQRAWRNFWDSVERAYSQARK